MPQTISPIIDSLGWALLHSLWQITLIAALVAVCLRLAPRANPQLRFCIAYFGIVGALLAFLVTFFVGLKPAVEVPVAAGTAVPMADDAIAAFLAMLGRSTSFVALSWCLGFVWLGTRYIQALRATRTLRREGISQVPGLWNDRFALWVERLGADRGTALLQSNRISTPITIGVFKPVVLVPAGFFLRLPTEQAEAVLVHEIAHICRQDYLLGLVQAMIANIFFFHPAIYYLSRQIDIEREYACDDRAARETGRAGALAAGLSRIAVDREAEALGFAMAANGPRTPIMDRINRLGGRPVAGDSEAGVPAAALVMVFAASMMIAVGAEASNGTEAVASDSATAEHHDPHASAQFAAVADARYRAAARSDASHGVAVAPSAVAGTRPATDPHRGAEHDIRGERSALSSGDRREWVQAGSRTDHVASKIRTARFAVAQTPRNSLFRTVAWEVRGTHEETDDCEHEHAMERRAERIAARAERHAERQARLAEREAERIEREMERRGAELERLAEQRAEHLAAAAERRADHLERQMEALAERRAAMIEREVERREREAERRERDAERRETRVVISFNGTVPAPPAPPRPPAPVVAISYAATGSL